MGHEAAHPADEVRAADERRAILGDLHGQGRRVHLQNDAAPATELQHAQPIARDGARFPGHAPVKGQHAILAHVQDVVLEGHGLPAARRPRDPHLAGADQPEERRIRRRRAARRRGPRAAGTPARSARPPARRPWRDVASPSTPSRRASPRGARGAAQSQARQHEPQQGTGTSSTAAVRAAAGPGGGRHGATRQRRPRRQPTAAPRLRRWAVPPPGRGAREARRRRRRHRGPGPSTPWMREQRTAPRRAEDRRRRRRRVTSAVRARARRRRGRGTSAAAGLSWAWAPPARGRVQARGAAAGEVSPT